VTEARFQQGVTGAELAAAVRAAASESGRPLTRFVDALGTSPLQRLREIENSKRPSERTIRRISQLLAGEPVERPMRYGDATRTARIAAQADGDPEPISAPVDRDPCFCCGVRGDLGCGCRR
jgi:hypothetical protein